MSVYGDIGVLASDDERVQCHICGKWFGHLGAHVSRLHGMTADEYRAEFGLNRTTGLIGPALAERRREHTEHLAAIGRQAREVQKWTREDRQRMMVGKSARLERRLNPQWRQHQADCVARMRAIKCNRVATT